MGDVETRFDTSNYDADDKRPLKIGVNNKVIGLMKDELGGKIITEFIALRPTHIKYLMVKKKRNQKEQRNALLKSKYLFKIIKTVMRRRSHYTEAS